nr:enoyl-CoA hydratase/isomerase family protein [Myxococcota bacterium]
MAESPEYSLRAGIGWLQMDDGGVNAMDLAWCQRMQSLLDRAEDDGSHGLVISGRPGCFSAGLNFKVLSRLAMPEVRETTNAFMETMKRVFLFPKPVLAASTGHAVAGGLMLFLAADIRIAVRENSSRYGLNEATTGVPFLGGTLGICRYGIPAQHHTEFILQGRMLDAQACADRGVIHELVEAERLLERASERLENLKDLAL